ncbi:MAG: hypothetical protein KDC34_14315 [Saprospiraceae bacterium]|nr:hypothetical protein [Saprospiraceae bacterium]
MTDTYDLLAPESRVWIYQINRELTESEVQEMDARLEQFAQQWTSHNQDLSAMAKVWHKRFVVLMVDESKAGASGCSIDSSVRFLQKLETQFGIHLFDRTTFLYLTADGKISAASMDEFKEAFAAGEISENTLVFDNLVNTKKAFEQHWQKPLSKSWHRRFV